MRTGPTPGFNTPNAAAAASGATEIIQSGDGREAAAEAAARAAGQCVDNSTGTAEGERRDERQRHAKRISE